MAYSKQEEASWRLYRTKSPHAVTCTQHANGRQIGLRPVKILLHARCCCCCTTAPSYHYTAPVLPSPAFVIGVFWDSNST